jgi:hypothetical protein
LVEDSFGAQVGAEVGVIVTGFDTPPKFHRLEDGVAIYKSEKPEVVSTSSRMFSLNDKNINALINDPDNSYKVIGIIGNSDSLEWKRSILDEKSTFLVFGEDFIKFQGHYFCGGYVDVLLGKSLKYNNSAIDSHELYRIYFEFTENSVHDQVPFIPHDLRIEISYSGTNQNDDDKVKINKFGAIATQYQDNYVSFSPFTGYQTDDFLRRLEQQMLDIGIDNINSIEFRHSDPEIKEFVEQKYREIRNRLPFENYVLNGDGYFGP